MQIDPETHIVNTEYLKVTKLTDQFWEKVISLGSLTALSLINCDNVSEGLQNVSKLTRLKRLKLSGVDLGDKIGELVLTDSIEELEIKRVQCESWENFTGSESIISFKYANLFLDELIEILPKLPSLKNVELTAFDDDEAEIVISLLRQCKNLENVDLSLYELSEKIITQLLEAAAESAIQLTIELEDSISLDQLRDIASKVGANISMRED